MMAEIRAVLVKLPIGKTGLYETRRFTMTEDELFKFCPVVEKEGIIVEIIEPDVVSAVEAARICMNVMYGQRNTGKDTS